MAAYAPVLETKPMTMIMVDPKERLFNITSTKEYDPSARRFIKVV